MTTFCFALLNNDKKLLIQAGFTSNSSWEELFRAGPLGTGDAVFGLFTPTDVLPGTDFVFASGEVYHLNTRAPWNLMEVGNFNTNLGQILRSYDGDGDGMDEIFAAKAKTVISNFFSLLFKRFKS
jgi:hypothetical protein